MTDLLALFKDPGIVTKIKKSVGLSLFLESEKDTNLLESEKDTNLVIRRANRGITVPRECSFSNPPTPTKYFLYLFYENWGSLKRCHTLYKVKIDLKKKSKIKAPSQILLEFPYGAKGMRCALLESKIYFLGGSMTVSENSSEAIYPRDVYVYDILTNEFEKMNAQLNAGKPNPCVVFAANGKVYAVPTIPDLPTTSGLKWSEELLFECFDPTISKWQVLNMPHVKEGCHITWFGSTVLLERQQVVVLGLESPGSGFVRFIYHLYEDKWTRHSIFEPGTTLPFQEGGQGEYLYGVALKGPPVKSKLPYLCWKDEIKLYNYEPLDGLILLSIPGKPMLEKGGWAEWVDTCFDQPYVEKRYSRLLRYIGHRHFCYVASGMLPNDGYALYPDPFIRGIMITLFKELPPTREEKFEVDILSSRRFEISEIKIPGTFQNAAELVGCYVYTREDQLQQSADKKKKKKSKKKNNNSSDS